MSGKAAQRRRAAPRRELEGLESACRDSGGEPIPEAVRRYANRLHQVLRAWHQEVVRRLVDAVHDGNQLPELRAWIDTIRSDMGDRYGDMLNQIVWQAVGAAARRCANCLNTGAKARTEFAACVEKHLGKPYADRVAHEGRAELERLARQRKPLDAIRA